MNQSRRVFLFRSVPAVVSTVAFFDIGTAYASRPLWMMVRDSNPAKMWQECIAAHARLKATAEFGQAVADDDPRAIEALLGVLERDTVWRLANAGTLHA